MNNEHSGSVDHYILHRIIDNWNEMQSTLYFDINASLNQIVEF
jgi:hypothetical protein